jgi:hypothetical protein
MEVWWGWLLVVMVTGTLLTLTTALQHWGY